MKNLVIKAILTMAAEGTTGMVGHNALIIRLNLDPKEVNKVLNELFQRGLITMQMHDGLKYIASTHLLYNACPALRPIAKCDFFNAFKAITICCKANERYHNTSVGKARHFANTLGVIVFDRALDRLVKASYVEVKVISPSFTALTVTNKGIKAYQIATGVDLSFHSTLSSSTPYVKKELSAEEKERQVLLKELADRCFEYNKLETRVRIGATLTKEELDNYSLLRVTLNSMRATLGLKEVDYAAVDIKIKEDVERRIALMNRVTK